MRKTIWIVLLILTLSLISACSNDEHSHSEHTEGIVEVELTVPEEAVTGNVVVLEAYVSQGNTAVEDADEVSFEIWQEGSKQDSIMIHDVDHADGIYSTEYTFEKAGTYMVQVHVTARRMHVMPKTEIIIND